MDDVVRPAVRKTLPLPVASRSKPRTRCTHAKDSHGHTETFIRLTSSTAMATTGLTMTFQSDTVGGMSSSSSYPCMRL